MLRYLFPNLNEAKVGVPQEEIAEPFTMLPSLHWSADRFDDTEKVFQWNHRHEKESNTILNIINGGTPP